MDNVSKRCQNQFASFLLHSVD